MFTDEPREYRGVSFKNFNQHYSQQVGEFTFDALSFSAIEDHVVDSIYNQFRKHKAANVIKNLMISKYNKKIEAGMIEGKEKNRKSLPAMIDIKVSAFDNTGRSISKVHRIVGVTPFKNNFVDQLYDISQAREQVEIATHQFIDSNYAVVFNQCKPMTQTNSTKVLRAPCCQKQFHEKCAISCRDSQVSACPNQVYKDGWTVVCCPQIWNNTFYEQFLQSPPLERKEIANENCSLCATSLRPRIFMGELLSERSAFFNKKQKIK